MPNYAGSGSGWATTPGNVGADDGAYAQDSWSRIFSDSWEETPTPYLVTSSFGFALGVGDRIDGIVIEVEAKRSGSNPNGTLYAFLAKSGVQMGSAKSAALNSNVDTVFTFGSSSDAWGSGMVGADVNALQVVVYAAPTSGSGTGTVSVDYVRATVTSVDTTPNAFTFTDVVSQPLSTLVVSNSITVAGIAAPAIVTMPLTALGEWEKNLSGVWTSGGGTVANGDTVRVRHTTSPFFSTSVDTTLIIGGIQDTFTSTTVAADTTPDAFGFTTQNNAEPSVQYLSNAIAVSGINSPANVSVSGSGGWYKNGVFQGTSAGTVVNGDQVMVNATASASFGGATSTTLTIGGVAGVYTVNTRAADTTPDQFTFTDVAGATTSTTYTSNTITVTGIEAAAAMSFSTSGGTNHKYSKNGGGFVAVGNTTIANGDTLAVQMTSPAGAGVSGNITVNIGGVTDTYSVVTTADTTPDDFNFTTQASAIPGVVYESNQVTINGINASTAVDVTGGGEASIAAGTYASSGLITNGQTLKVRVRAPVRKGASVTINVTVGTLTKTFTVNNIIGEPDIAIR
jgi:hypothetical protein